MELLEHKSIFTAGYKCILHVHAAVEECECIQLDARLDMKTKQKVTVRITQCGISLVEDPRAVKLLLFCFSPSGAFVATHITGGDKQSTLFCALQAKHVKSGSVVICKLAVEKPICVELFKDVPQLVRPLTAILLPGIATCR